MMIRKKIVPVYYYIKMIKKKKFLKRNSYIDIDLKTNTEIKYSDNIIVIYYIKISLLFYSHITISSKMNILTKCQQNSKSLKFDNHLEISESLFIYSVDW